MEKKKLKDYDYYIIRAIVAIVVVLFWFVLVIATYTDKPDYAKSPDEVIRTK